jgi:thiopeptide-type bacteriocin biosynthesis protein
MVSDSGIGWPDGYPGSPPAEQARLSGRDELLLALAQDAALDGHDEVLLDEATVAALETGPASLRPPPHLELGVRIHAADTAAMERGDFTVHVVTVSRAAGVLTGRFLPVLDAAGSAALSAVLASVPCNDPETAAVQLSFPPLDPATAHVTRVPQLFPAVISLGEHRQLGDAVLTAADLAAGCDGRRMYHAVPRQGTRVEPVALHALNLRRHTPPLARLLTELSRAQCAQVTGFDWGAAARLPFLPRVRSGRTVLSPARWRLAATALPGRQASWPQWAAVLHAWAGRRRVPRLVHLVEGDQRLPLDLAEPAHRAVLRAHLAGTAHAIVTEAPAGSDHGWSGGRPHEIIIPLTAARPARWPLLPAPGPARLVRPGNGHLPATGGVLLASLYGDLQRQDEILASYLPDLLGRLGGQPRWWYIRYRDPEQHLRLRIILASPDAFGLAARTVSIWAARLREQGLLREVRYPADYPETGRWGSGLAWAAAQQVFEADSAAVLTQLRLPGQPARQALAAAHAVSISAAFTASIPAGMQWLLDHIPAAAPGRVPRPVLDQARHLADPAADWAALRSGPGGEAIRNAWADRDRALAAYRTHLDGPAMAGIRADDVLSSLLHVNFVRGYRIDFGEEAVCMYLARAAALTSIARAGGKR